MKFTEWWDFRGGRLAPADTMYRHRDLKNWCGLAYNDGITEGLRRAQVASEAPSQGGGSQGAAKAPVGPCQGGCPTICAGCPKL